MIFEIIQQRACVENDGIFVSPDGYVRISEKALDAIVFYHLFSSLDETESTMPDGDASLTGYTEWMTNTQPGITLGWDWALHTCDTCRSLRRTGTPRFNIMVTNSLGDRDLGVSMTIFHLKRLIDSLPWQVIVWENASPQGHFSSASH